METIQITRDRGRVKNNPYKTMKKELKINELDNDMVSFAMCNHKSKVHQRHPLVFSKKIMISI